MVIIALEIVKGEFGRAYAAIIKDGSSASFKSFFEKHIGKDADVVTDEWAGYTPLKSTYKKLTQIPSNDGKNFPELHLHIMNHRCEECTTIAAKNGYKDIWTSTISGLIDETVWKLSLMC